MGLGHRPVQLTYYSMLRVKGTDQILFCVPHPTGNPDSFDVGDEVIINRRYYKILDMDQHWGPVGSIVVLLVKSCLRSS